MSVLVNNLKFLRKRAGYTQEQLAQQLGVKRPIIGAYEEGRAEPKLNTLQNIAGVFEVSIDSLLSEDISSWKEENFSNKKTDVKGTRLRVLTVSVDDEDREGVHLVPQKASAGYMNGFSDPEFLEELPRLYLPMLSGGSYRAFELKGDSMMPLQSGTLVIGQYVENWTEIKSGQTYILITKQEGVVYKRVNNRIYEEGELTLISDNKEYSPYSLSVEDVMEVWEAKMYVSSEFPEKPAGAGPTTLEQLGKMVTDLQQEVSRLKGRM